MMFAARKRTSRAKQPSPRMSRLPYQSIRRKRSECADQRTKTKRLERIALPRRWTLFFKDIADSAHGMDQARLVARFELVAQVADVHFQHVRGPLKVQAPDAVHDDIAREHLAGTTQE